MARVNFIPTVSAKSDPKKHKNTIKIHLLTTDLIINIQFKLKIMEDVHYIFRYSIIKLTSSCQNSTNKKERICAT